MIKTLKSDFYKLLRQKSFYVCLIISVVAVILSTILQNYSMKMMYAQYNIPYDPSEIGMNGVGMLQNGLGAFDPTFLLIFMVLFTVMEFSKGTIKNQISRGRHRFKIYLSKMITTIVASLVFMLITIAAAYLTAVQIGGTGEPMTREIALPILKNVGFYFLTLVSYLSLFLMFAFLVRNTGVALAIVLLAEMIVKLLCELINSGLKYLFNINFHSAKYWIGSCFATLPDTATRNDILIRVAICLAYLLVSTAIGIFVFWRKEIK